MSQEITWSVIMAGSGALRLLPELWQARSAHLLGLPWIADLLPIAASATAGKM